MSNDSVELAAVIAASAARTPPLDEHSTSVANRPVITGYTTDEADIHYATTSDEAKDNDHNNNHNPSDNVYYNPASQTRDRVVSIQLVDTDVDDDKSDRDYAYGRRAHATFDNYNASRKRSNTFGYNVYSVSQMVKKESKIPIFSTISTFSKL